MRRRWIIIAGTALLLLAAIGVVAWPLTDPAAASIAKRALSHVHQAEGREPTDITEANGIKLVSFGVVDGYDYVVQVRSRWASGEVHRIPTDGG